MLLFSRKAANEISPQIADASQSQMSSFILSSFKLSWEFKARIARRESQYNITGKYTETQAY